MTRRRIVFALAASLAAACGGSDPISWTDASDSERIAALLAAYSGGSHEGFLADGWAEVDSYDGGCPKRIFTDEGHRYEADGCVGSKSGATYRGILEVTSDEDEFHSKYVFTDFSMHGPDIDIEADGTHESHFIVQESSHITIVKDGVKVRVDLDVACTLMCPNGEEEACTLDCKSTGDAHGSVEGLGTFDIVLDGTGGRALRGRDTLRLAAETDADGCLGYTIDGQPAGKYCQ